MDTPRVGQCFCSLLGPSNKSGKSEVQQGLGPVLLRAAFQFSNLRPVLSDAYESL
jgi:hypothetical protein